MPIVPTIIEKTQRGERFYDIFSRLLEERIIFLAGPITDMTANLVVAQILYLASRDSKRDIKIYINSPGGSVTAGLAIYDTIKYVKCPVSTICVGMTASMAAILLAAGTKGKRFSLSLMQGKGVYPGRGERCRDLEMLTSEYVPTKIRKSRGPCVEDIMQQIKMKKKK